MTKSFTKLTKIFHEIDKLVDKICHENDKKSWQNHHENDKLVDKICHESDNLVDKKNHETDKKIITELTIS